MWLKVKEAKYESRIIIGWKWNECNAIEGELVCLCMTSECKVKVGWEYFKVVSVGKRIISVLYKKEKTLYESEVKVKVR